MRLAFAIKGERIDSSDSLPLEGRAGEGGGSVYQLHHPSLTLPLKGMESEGCSVQTAALCYACVAALRGSVRKMISLMPV
jgi:hypothetical protein